MKIARKCNGSLDGKLYKVRFDTPEDINLNGSIFTTETLNPLNCNNFPIPDITPPVININFT